MRKLERLFHLQRQHTHDLGILAKNLGTHAVALHAHGGVCLQPLNEVLDGREILGLQGVVTDVDGNYHGFQ